MFLLGLTAYANAPNNGTLFTVLQDASLCVACRGEKKQKVFSDPAFAFLLIPSIQDADLLWRHLFPFSCDDILITANSGSQARWWSCFCA